MQYLYASVFWQLVPLLPYVNAIRVLLSTIHSVLPSFANGCKFTEIKRGPISRTLQTYMTSIHVRKLFFYLNKKYNFTQKSILSKIFFLLFSCIFTIFLVCDKKFHCLEQLAACIQSHSYTVLLLRKEKQDFHRRRFWYTNTSNKQGGKRKWYLENCVT